MFSKDATRPSLSSASSKVLVTSLATAETKAKPLSSNPTSLEFPLRPFRERFYHSGSCQLVKWLWIFSPLFSLLLVYATWADGGSPLRSLVSTLVVLLVFSSLWLVLAVGEARYGLQRVLWGETDVTFVLQRYTKRQIVSVPLKDLRLSLEHGKGNQLDVRFFGKYKFLFSLRFPGHPHREEILEAFKTVPTRSLSEYLAHRFFGK